MVKSGNTYKVLYTKIVFVTCKSHGLHRVAEYVRIQYLKLVANVKLIFKKAPDRIKKFKDEAPNNLYPPPHNQFYVERGFLLRFIIVITSKLLKVFMQMKHMRYAQKHFKAPQIKCDLAFIKSNFECLPVAITIL